MRVSGDRRFAYSAVLVSSFVLALVPAWARQADSSEQKADLSRLVVVGDSLGAGFQNFSLYDSDSDVPPAPPGGQRHGFVALIAQQANVDLHLPLIQYPGIPPVLTIEGDVISRSPLPPGSREPQTLAVQTSNLSVPGFNVADALFHSENVPNVLNNLGSASLADIFGIEVLGFPSFLNNPPAGCGLVFADLTGDVVFSQALCAVQLQPTTILVSLGNGDALQSLTQGTPPTDAATFSGFYNSLLYSLSSGTTAKIVVSNIPDVAAVPFLVSYREFKATCHVPPSGAGPDDYLVPNPDPANPTFNVCTNYFVRSGSLIAEARAAVRCSFS
jgi:hypothetical protein